MYRKIKNNKEKNSKNKQYFLLFCFVVFFFLLFFNVSPTHATSQCVDMDGANSKIDSTEGYTRKQCQDYCKEKGIEKNDCGWTPNAEAGYWSRTEEYAYGESAGCSFSDPSTWLICLLSPLLFAVKLIFGLGITLLGWVIKPDNLSFVLDGNGLVLEIWVFIKDLLNIAFILVLLFSAFATIFQVERYNYKKILLTLIIMALLVNFSYPIARIITDFANILMYSLVNNFFSYDSSATTFTTELVSNSGIQELFSTDSYTSSGMMLVAIIFLFIFSITIIAFAVLLFVRMTALALLIMTSAIGLAGNIMPGFESFAKKWWENLFRYAFFGPIMMLGMYVSIKMLIALKNMSGMAAFAEAELGGGAADPNLIGNMALFIIPIIMLWMTMGIAQSMSIAGAGAVMGKAQSIIKKTGKSVSGYNFTKNTLDKYKSERKDRKEALGKTKLSYRLGNWSANRVNQMGDLRDRGELIFKKNEGDGTLKKTAKFIGRRAPGINPDLAEERTTDLRRKKIQEQLNDWKKQGGIEEDELKKIISNKKKSESERQAAALELSKEYGFRGDDAFNNFVLAKEVMKNDKALDKTFSDNTKKKRLDIVISYDIANPGAGKNGAQIAKEKFDSLSVDDFKNINFKALTKENGSKSTQAIAEQAAREYFESINQSSNERQKDIFKKINAENQAFIEQNIIQQNQGQSWEYPI